jgi:hypothetical protein
MTWEQNKKHYRLIFNDEYEYEDSAQQLTTWLESSFFDPMAHVSFFLTLFFGERGLGRRELFGISCLFRASPNSFRVLLLISFSLSFRNSD